MVCTVAAWTGGRGSRVLGGYAVGTETCLILVSVSISLKYRPEAPILLKGSARGADPRDSNASPAYPAASLRP
jgi:hypothetical protein